MIKKIIGTTGARFFSAFLTFVILWIITNYLGKEGLGTISLIILDIAIILLLNDFIGGSALVYYTPRRNVSKLLSISYTWAFIVIIIFFGIFRLLSIFPLIYATIIPQGFEYHILALGLLNTLSFINLNILVGKENIKMYNSIFVIQIFTLFLSLVFFVFIINKVEVISYVYSLYISQGISFLLGVLCLKKHFTFKNHDHIFVLIKEILNYGSMTQFANIIHLTNKRLSFYVIKSFIGIGSLGIYSAGVQLSEGLRLIGQSISIVQFARISNTTDMDYAKKLTLQLLKFTVLITAFCMIILLLIPTNVFEYIFSKDFGDIRPVMFSLSIGVVSIAASMIFSHYFSGTGKPKYNAISAGVGLVFTLIFAFILIPKYGIIGAGITATLAYSASAIYQLIIFIRITKLKLPEFFLTKMDVEFFIAEVKKIKALKKIKAKIEKIISKIILRLTRDVHHLKKGIKCNYEWHGNDYGGFYICPDLLNKNSIVYSFGIGEDISFDESIIKKYGCKSYGFDPTPQSINWLKHQVLPDNFSFYPFGISDKTEITNFYLPINQEHVSGSSIKHSNVTEKRIVQVQMKSIDDIINELGHKKIDVLKMDIEGSEYEIIESILNTDINIDQILIEFHDQFFENGIMKTRKAVKMLQENGYEIFAVSDSYDEVSFIRKNAL
ncbi:MAG: FkbM family methyltransferase [Bacteroidales bacterium]|nr:FkbM family methyltransferase [Bacteroidales bacterium]